MSHDRLQELAMKFIDVDETPPDRPLELSGDTDVVGLRPEQLDGALDPRAKAMVRSALFGDPREAPALGSYQLLRRLGEGGMGVVYAAYDDKLERKVALKLIRGAATRGADARARTLREARALARLSHPNVVHVYQVGEVDHEIFVAMEFVTGPTLRAWLAAGPRSWRDVLAVFRQAGEGLAAAHRQGVIHRDFKPANVIVGDDGRVRVLDFGLAHFAGDVEAARALPGAGAVTDVLLTQTGAVLGTPAYMAAEQFAGARGDARADQFSFCVALFEALYGQRPFTGDTLDALVPVVVAGLVRPTPAGRDVPAWLHRAVLRGLHPDPAARWPSMDALLLALSPPERRMRPSRVVATVAASLALVAGGVLAVLDAPGDPQRVAEREAAVHARADADRAHDDKLLTEARAALPRDPTTTLRTLAKLAGDAPATWQQARFLAAAAQARGLPADVLRAGERPLAEVFPLTGGGFIGRDELGAVWHWKLSEKTATEVLPPGAGRQLLVARDAPVWAVKSNTTIRVFGREGGEQTIDIAAVESQFPQWSLAADGDTLVASAWMRPNTEGLGGSVHLWDLTGPGSLPQAIAIPAEIDAVIAADASIVTFREFDRIRIVRSRDGSETTLPYRGRPWTVSADARFILAHPDDADELLDVIELETGEVRRINAAEVVVLAGSDVLFTRRVYQSVQVWRESLDTGTRAWTMVVPTLPVATSSRLVVDPAHEQFALSLGEDWAVGDLRRGALTSFITVPKDRTPQWSGAGALMVATREDVRIHRPADAPVQLRATGSHCDLSPNGRWAIVQPRDLERGDYLRLELATGAQTTFRCPLPPTLERDDEYRAYGILPMIDDTGQVAVLGEHDWHCWWDDRRGVSTGPDTPHPDRLITLPRGVAFAAGTEVQAWAAADERTHTWTIAAPVGDLSANATGTAIAVRHEHGVELLRLDSGETLPVITNPAPVERRELSAGGLAWSRDGARLAVLDQVDGTLDLRVWDVAEDPREIAHPVLKDSPGRPRNWLAFTPSGTSIVLTDRHESLARIDLERGDTQRLSAPDMFTFHLRSETDLVGVDIEEVPLVADFAASDHARLTPDPKFGGSTRPPIQASADGRTWTCDALGPGTLIEIAAPDEALLADPRKRIRELADAL